MKEFWESKFKEEGTMWEFEPSDSAVSALELFTRNNIKNILIPGAGYGRNAKLFCDHGLNVTGIEISESAIKLAKLHGLKFKIHLGSVTSMPFDNEKFDGIFCYALIHLLNKTERQLFLRSCYYQLKNEGLMVFVIASKQMNMYGNGAYLSKDRYEISRGLKVFFYDTESVIKEFSGFGLIEFNEIEEPIKHMTGQDPLKLIFVICKKKKEL